MRKSRLHRKSDLKDDWTQSSPTEPNYANWMDSDMWSAKGRFFLRGGGRLYTLRLP